MRNRIFISYNRQDEQFTRKLATDLSEAGADVWIDVEDIPSGVSWSNFIDKGLRTADAMLLIMSPSSMTSRNVFKEWHFFLHKRQQPLIPILWQDCDPHFELYDLQYVDFRDYMFDYEDAFNKLLIALENAGIELAQEPIPLANIDQHLVSEIGGSSRQPLYRSSRRQLGLATLLVLLITGIIGLLILTNNDESVNPLPTEGNREVVISTIVTEPMPSTIPTMPSTVVDIKPPPVVAIMPDEATPPVAEINPTSPSIIEAGTMPLLSPSNAAQIEERAIMYMDETIFAVEFAPSMQYIAAGDSGNQLHLFTLKNDNELDEAYTTLEGHTWWIRAIDFSPDGSLIATGSRDRSVIIWKTDTQEPVTILTEHDNYVTDVEFTGDGTKLVTGSLDGKIRIWDTTTWALQQTIENPDLRGVYAVAISPDGEVLASGDADGRIMLWDMSKGETMATFHEHPGVVRSIAFSPDGQVIVSGGNWMISLIDVPTITLIEKIPQDFRIWSVAFSPDGNLFATGGADETISLWNPKIRRIVTRLEKHTADVWSITFSPDGSLIASSGADGTIRIWGIPPQE